MSAASPERVCRFYTRKDLDRIPQLAALPPEDRAAMRAVSWVLPFRVNHYVVEELIRWERVPNDPIYQLTFPQRDMLAPDDLATMTALVAAGAPEPLLRDAIQRTLNPHPAGQMELNVPRLGGTPLPGMQHKYRETVLFFPAQGQTCHSYCTYCFRWPQFVGLDDLKFSNREAQALVAYLREHPEVTSVLFTGGDPLIMRTRVLRRYLEPLLAAGLDHLQSIRIGTKAPAYWPYRFVGGEDADDLLRLFEEVVAAGKHLALMAHYSHPQELSTPVARQAVRRIRSAGAVVRSQAPLVRHVNDSAAAWREIWKEQVRLGVVPYYMFIERDTGPKNYFEVPLVRALEIFNDAYSAVSGLARTVRGPSMSATPGKVLVDGVATVGRARVFVLKVLQGRDPAWVGRTFFARYDPKATWLTDLEPAFGERSFFFEPPIAAEKRADHHRVRPRRPGGRRHLRLARGGDDS